MTLESHFFISLAKNELLTKLPEQMIAGIIHRPGTHGTASCPFFLAWCPLSSGLPLASTPGYHAWDRMGNYSTGPNKSHQILSPEPIR